MASEKTQLPGGWVAAPLSEAIQPRTEKVVPSDHPESRFIGMDHVESLSTKILGSLPAAAMKSSAASFRAGDVLYGRLRPYLNKVAQPNFDGLASAEFIVFPDTVLISSPFLKHRLNAADFVSYASHLNEGDRPRVSFDQIGEFEILIPPPLEQHRIVAKIEELFSELDKGIESLKTARAKLKVYRQAVLKYAFEGKLTAQWRGENKDKLEKPDQLLARIKQEREARYERQLQEWNAAVKEWEEGGKSGKRPSRPRMPKSVSTMAEEEIAHLEALPSGWLWLTAESVGIVQLGRQRSPKNRSKDYPTKYIRAANITEQGLDLDDILDMNFDPNELSTYRLEKGDLVLSEASGSAAQVGKPAIWDDQIPNCCFQNTVIRHQPYCRDHAAYLLWLYRFFYVSGKFARVAGGVGINHLSAYKFAQIALPLCALAEQQKIVCLLEERFAAIEQQERGIDSALKQAETLRQAILKKAFSGQLVAQDPHDEPASFLLDRIRAEREKAVKNNRSKKTKRKKAAA